MTIKELAKLTHLSVSTVSKALNNQNDVSKETKELVLEYAKKYGYKTKEERMFERKHTRLVIIHSDMGLLGNNSILYPVSMSFNKVATKNNSEVVYYDITELPEFNFNRFMEQNKYDGALILGITNTHSLIKQLKNTKFPVVLYDNTLVHDLIANIGTDNIGSITELFEHLYNLGHRRIAFIGGNITSNVSVERLSGYIIGLAKHNIEYDSKIVFWGGFNKDTGAIAADELINTDVTAVICACDLIAVGLIERYKQLGKRIPDDLSVTGFDDFEISNIIEPHLTTIHQDFNRMGREAYKLLAYLILNRAPQRIILPGKIVYRDSVKQIN